jgi:hypothetical protein
MDIGARPHVCGHFFFIFFMFVLLLLMVYIVVGLHILCWCRYPEVGTGSIDWAQMSRFLHEDGD